MKRDKKKSIDKVNKENKYRSLINEVANKPWLIERRLFFNSPWSLFLIDELVSKYLPAIESLKYTAPNSLEYRKIALISIVFKDYVSVRNVLECSNLCVKHDPKDGRNYLIRAYAQLQYKHYQDATNDINYYLKYNGKNNGEIYRWRGWIYFKQNKLKKALSDFNRCVEIEPDNFMIYVNRGELYIKLKEYDKAICDFDTHLLVFPENFDDYDHYCPVKIMPFVVQDFWHV